MIIADMLRRAAFPNAIKALPVSEPIPCIELDEEAVKLVGDSEDGAVELSNESDEGFLAAVGYWMLAEWFVILGIGCVRDCISQSRCSDSRFHNGRVGSVYPKR